MKRIGKIAKRKRSKKRKLPSATPPAGHGIEKPKDSGDMSSSPRSSISSTEDRADVIILVKEIVQTIFSAGPLPPSHELEKCNKLIPNGAERLMIMVEKQSAHRINADAKIVDHAIKSTTRAQWMAFIGFLLMIGIGGVLIFLGRSIEGFGTMLTGVAIVIGAFLAGTRKRRNSSR